jgi:hypothetical protein
VRLPKRAREGVYQKAFVAALSSPTCARQREGGIAPQESAEVLTPIPHDHWGEHLAPAVRAIEIRAVISARCRDERAGGRGKIHARRLASMPGGSQILQPVRSDVRSPLEGGAHPENAVA